jgi:hypothetical protein
LLDLAVKRAAGDASKLEQQVAQVFESLRQPVCRRERERRMNQALRRLSAQGQPNVTFTSSDFGKITSAGDPRRVQFGMKCVF